MNLQNLNVQEVKSIDGGQIVEGLKWTYRVYRFFVKNKETKFVKDTFAGSDAIYP